jgi:hypothetical protein
VCLGPPRWRVVLLKWAFSEAAVLFLRHAAGGTQLLKDIEKTHGTVKALSIVAHTIGRSVYYILSRRTVFVMEKFRAATGAGEPDVYLEPAGPSSYRSR